jgi:hypothetical protein
MNTLSRTIIYFLLVVGVVSTVFTVALSVYLNTIIIRQNNIQSVSSVHNVKLFFSRTFDAYV